MLRAALEGELANVPFRRHPEFGLMIPEACPGVPDEVLDPKATWADQKAYESMALDVAKRFEDNFARFAPHVGEDVKSAGIHPSG
jgi:phosphoenolpyruvate carboxykinase (ATP)